MRKMVFGRKLSRGKKSREALFRSLIRGMVISGKIVTTRAKAKAVIGQIDKLITTAKQNTISSRRRVLAYLANDREITNKLVDVIALTFSSRNSGYTRLFNLPPRKGDNAQMARIEWVEAVKEIEKPEKKEKKVVVKKEVKKEPAKVKKAAKK